MSKLEDLYTLVRLLKEFEFPVSPILEYTIKEKENELLSDLNKGQIELAERQSSTSTDSERIIAFSTLKDEYSSYVHKIKSESSANENLQILNGPVRRYINQIVDPAADSIYSYKGLADFNFCIQKLKSDSNFAAANLRRRHKYTGALSVYQKFIESKENGYLQ